MNSDQKTYSELMTIPSYTDRIEYLILNSSVGMPTFDGHRYLNQQLYSSPEWRRLRREIIYRDSGCDLGHEDHPIQHGVTIHHINPITIDDVLHHARCVYDPENLITTRTETHKMIHYGDVRLIRDILDLGFAERKQNDTCPWKR